MKSFLHILSFSSLSFGVKALATICGFLTVSFIGKNLGPGLLGEYSYILSLITILAIPIQSGLPALLIRDTTRFRIHKNWDNLRGLYIWAALVLISLFILGTSTFYILFDINYLAFLNIHEELLIEIWLLVFLISLVSCFGAFIRGLGFPILGQISEKLVKPLLIFSAIFIPLFLVNVFEINWGIRKLILINIYSSIFAIIVASIVVKFTIPSELTKSFSIKINNKEWLVALLPFSVIAFMQLINTNLDILTLTWTRSLDEVGVYRAMLALSALVIFGQEAVNQLMQPTYIKYHYTEKNFKLQKTVSHATSLVALFSIAASIILLYYSEIFINIFFGENYNRGNEVLVILVVGQLVNAWFGPTALLLKSTGHEKKALYALIYSSVINIIGHLFLTRYYGPEGAALTLVVTIFTWNAIMYYFVKKLLSIDCSIIGVFQLFLKSEDKFLS